MPPIIVWKPILRLEDFTHGRPAGPHDVVWQGDDSQLDPGWLAANVPETSAFHASATAWVNDLEIGHIGVRWTPAVRGKPYRFSINAYSVFDPKKRGGGYGRDFSTPAAAKGYVGLLFFNIVDKAGLIAKP
jgi:hypothetical protein